MYIVIKMFRLAKVELRVKISQMPSLSTHLVSSFLNDDGVEIAR